MGKVKSPRDWTSVKSKIVGFLLETSSGKGKWGRGSTSQNRVFYSPSTGWIFLCLILSYGLLGVLWRVGIRNSMAVEGEVGIILTIVFFFLPRIVFRGILKYREVPSGWTPEQAKAWEDLKEKTTKSYIEKILDILEIFFDGIRDARMGFEHVKQETERTHNMKWKDFKFSKWIKIFLMWVGGLLAFVAITLWFVVKFVKDGNLVLPIFIGMLVSIFIFARIYAKKTRFKRKYLEE